LSKGSDIGKVLLIKLLNLDHVGIAVNNLDHALDEYRAKYGISPLYRETVSSQGVEEAMIPLGGSFIQLLQPLGPDTPVGRFLDRKGEGVHHLAYAVADINAALNHLKDQGARLIDTEARPGGGGASIAFVHPRDLAGTLIELVEPHD
jgi:methylmalonyl-CoA/ethylmalonyl-CoA epimerase